MLSACVKFLMIPIGLEPTSWQLWVVCFNQLNYRTKHQSLIYANYQMLFNVETCQNEVLDHKILEHDFLDDDLIIEIGSDVRTLID